MKTLFLFLIIICFTKSHAHSQPIDLSIQELPLEIKLSLEKIALDNDISAYDSMARYFPKQDRYLVESRVTNKDYTKAKYFFGKDGTLVQTILVYNKASLPQELIIAIQNEANGDKLKYVNKNINEVSGVVKYIVGTATFKIVFDSQFQVVKKSSRG